MDELGKSFKFWGKTLLICCGRITGDNKMLAMMLSAWLDAVLIKNRMGWSGKQFHE